MNAAGVGGSAIGAGPFLQDYAFPVIQLSPGVTGRRRSQFGFGQLSSRVYSRAYPWTVPPRNTSSTGGVDISLSSFSGGLLGKIRTDIEFPIVESLTFVNDENGSADFTLKLSEQPDIAILPMALLQANIGNSDFNWYKGQITAPDIKGTRYSLFEFKGYGLRRYLDTLQANTTYLAGQDVSDVIEDLVQNWIVNYCPIKFSGSKIDSPTGVVLASDMALGKFTLSKVFQTLAEMCSNVNNEYFYVWGVDGEGEFYWTRITNTIVKTLLVGYDANEFEPTENYDNIKNAIFLQRQQGLGADGAGWAAAGVFNDESSIAKYGRNALTFQIPGFFGDGEADLIGNSLLASMKDPVTSAKLSNYEILGPNEFFRPGMYRIIMPLDTYQITEDDIDSAGEFVKFGSGDLAAVNDDNFFVWGRRGVRLQATNAINDRMELTIGAEGIIQKIQFFVRASHSGAFFTVGIGQTVWNEHTLKVDIPASNTFIPVTWDVSALNLRKITKFAIQINENFSAQHRIWVDKLDFIYRGHLTFKVRMKRATYTFAPGKSTATIEFGELPKRLQDYVAGLISAATEFNAVNEVL